MLRNSPALRIWMFATGAVLITAFALRVAVNHYRGAAIEFESWTGESALVHPDLLALPSDLKSVRFATAQGSVVSGWFVPAHRAGVIILVHGTNSDRLSMLSELRWFVDAGFGVLAMDWPGHGQSRGVIDWDDHERDALRSAINWVAAETREQQQIGLLGFSFGGIIAAQVAAEEPKVSALVLSGTPTSFDDYERLHHDRWSWLSLLPARWAIRTHGVSDKAMTPAIAVGKLAPRPVLLVGGSADAVVPPSMVDQMYAAAKAPKYKLIVAGAEHGQYSRDSSDQYRKALVSFFSSNLAAVPISRDQVRQSQ